MTPFEIIPLFPQALYKSKFRPITADERTTIEKFPVAKQQLGNSTSNKPYFLDEIGLENLKSDIANHISAYAREVMKFDLELYITNSWKNLTVPGEQHIIHNHTNSVISGVLYLNVSNSQPSISFNRMSSPYLLNYLPTEFNLFNSIDGMFLLKMLQLLYFHLVVIIMLNLILVIRIDYRLHLIHLLVGV